MNDTQTTNTMNAEIGIDRLTTVVHSLCLGEYGTEREAINRISKITPVRRHSYVIVEDDGLYYVMNRHNRTAFEQIMSLIVDLLPSN